MMDDNIESKIDCKIDEKVEIKSYNNGVYNSLKNMFYVALGTLLLSSCATTLKPEVKEINNGIFARACSSMGDVSTKRDMTEYEAKTMIADYLTEGKGGEVTLENTMTRYKRQGDQICAEVYLKR